MLKHVFAWMGALAVFVPMMAFAADNSCFCLIHSSGAIYRNCQETPGAHGNPSTLSCLDAAGAPSLLSKVPPNFSRAASGTQNCPPCTDEPVHKYDNSRPRGSGGQ